MSEKKGTYTTRKFSDPLDDLLDRPVAYNPAFKKITGSTVAALMLSQAWYWTKRTSDEAGWFYKTQAEWEDETGLTRSEYLTARQKLKDLGIMEEDLRGVPATLYYRIDKPKIYEMMGVQFAETLQSSLPESSDLVRGNPANINRTGITTENTTSVSLGIENRIALGLPILENEHEMTKLREDAPRQFENAFRFPALKWDSTKEWRELREFVVETYRRDAEAFINYVIWRAGDGKFKALSNARIVKKPTDLILTWGEFEASQSQIQPAEVKYTYRKPTPEEEKLYVPNPNTTRPRIGRGNGTGNQRHGE